jgi:lipoate-protein ligase A
VHFLDLSFNSPAHNLALDEALLESAEAGESGPVLRFWESPTYFVALGYTNRAHIEANWPACEAQKVPILRRCSGGGTVLQGPGCLNYALVHPIAEGQALNVGATNAFVMETNRAALQGALGSPIELAGHTDLAMEGRKFSGNAQKRKARFFLFHGTILLDFDLDLVQTLLLPPSKEPDYRARRSHLEFIRNIPVRRETVKKALRDAWGASEKLEILPPERTDALVEEKYRCDEWNFKF